jgi:hypothetical protein
VVLQLATLGVVMIGQKIKEKIELASVGRATIMNHQPMTNKGSNIKPD